MYGTLVAAGVEIGPNFSRQPKTRCSHSLKSNRLRKGREEGGGSREEGEGEGATPPFPLPTGGTKRQVNIHEPPNGILLPPWTLASPHLPAPTCLTSAAARVCTQLPSLFPRLSWPLLSLLMVVRGSLKVNKSHITTDHFAILQRMTSLYMEAGSDFWDV